jgi:hypothetical protein
VLEKPLRSFLTSTPQSGCLSGEVMGVARKAIVGEILILT